MPEMHQPPSDPSEPDTVEPTAADGSDVPEDVPPVIDGDEELGEIAGGDEITDIGAGSPAS